MKLLEDLTYVDPSCRAWLAPAGAIVDGASIPQLAWSVIGGPFEGKYRDASVIHDVACDQKGARWEDVHLVFYNAMLARGVEHALAKVMYAAVYHFGPRWPTPPSPSGKGGPRPPLPRSLREEDFNKLKQAILSREPSEAGGMTLEEIQSFKP